MAYPSLDYSSAVTSSGSAVSSLTFNIPLNVCAVGDLMIAVAYSDNTTTTAQFSTSESGWSLTNQAAVSDSDVAIGIFYKIAEASDITGSASITIDAQSSDQMIISFHCVSNVRAGGAPIVRVASYNNPSNPKYIPTCRASHDQTLCIAFGAWDGADCFSITAGTNGWTTGGSTRSGGSSADSVSASWATNTIATALAYTGQGNFYPTVFDGNYTFGISISPFDPYDVQPGVVSLTITENAASVAFDVTVTTVAESLTLTEQQASVVNRIDVNATTQAITVTSNQAILTYDVDVLAGVDTLAITTQQAGVALILSVAANTDALTLNEQQASIAYDREVFATSPVFTVTVHSPSVTTDLETYANNLWDRSLAEDTESWLSVDRDTESWSDVTGDTETWSDQ